jgi:hypothetical protein
MRGCRRMITGSRGAGAAAALALAVLFGNIPAGVAQSIQSNCTFTDADVAGLFAKIATALGRPAGNTTGIVVPIVIVPTFNENLGQPLTAAANSTFSPMVICRNSDEIGPFGSTTESARFPTSGTADLLEIQQTTYVLIDELPNAPKRLRLCHTDRTNTCIVGTE